MTLTAISQSRPFPRVEGVEHRFVEARGVRFHVAEAGTGEPVMLLHSFPQHWYAWRHVIPRLAGDYRVICPDFRGFGWSDAPARGYDTANRAADLIAVMDALGLERVWLVGHGWGAWAGFFLCLQAPERVRGYLALNMVHPWLTHRAALTGSWRQWHTALWEYPLVGPQVLRRCPGLTRYLLRHWASDLRIRTVQGCGHLLPEERPDLVASTVRELSRAT